MNVLKTILTIILITFSATNEISGEKTKKNIYSDTLRKNDTISGIDISFYQKNIQWYKLPNDICFVVIKATEGSKIKDSKFKENWELSSKNQVFYLLVSLLQI